MVVFKSIRLAALIAVSILIGSCAWVDGSGGGASMRQSVLVAGADHACALVGDGAVKCWGRNNLGQLGGGDIPLSSVAVAVPNVPDATYLAAGTDHTCAVVANGRVYCWGRNSDGQLGAGTRSVSSRPVEVEGVDGAIGVAAGDGHSCALRSDGAVLCWGANARGQLGNGSNEPSLAPVPVAGVTTATAIVGGPEHTCALVENGEVRCWGRNDDGQLGNGKTTDSNTPVAVKDVVNADGVDSFCAVRDESTVVCASRTSSDGVHVRSGGIAAVADLSGGVGLFPRWGGACVELGDGSRQCWSFRTNASSVFPGYSAEIALHWKEHTGSISKGYIGPGPCTIEDDVRLECPGLSALEPDVTQGSADPFAGTIGVGSWSFVARAHSCAMIDDGRVFCWGPDPFGKTGNSARFLPEASRVLGVDGVTSIAASGNHTCASTMTGTVACWGQLPTLLQIYFPVVFALSPTFVAEIDTATIVHSTREFDCASTLSGWMQCWPGSVSFGVAENLSHPVLLNEITDVEKITGACVLAEGRVLCRQSTGESIWNGVAGFRPSLAEVPLEAPASSIAPGQNHTCVLLNTGRVNCFDLSYYASGADKPSFGTPFEIPGIAAAVAIAGDCAVVESGTIACWSLTRNYLGKQAVSVTSPVPSISDAIELAVGDGYSCALHRDGTVSCWGHNYEGNLGDGTYESSNVPVRVKGVEHAEKIVAGDSHTCALLADKTVTCWGDNSYGQRGNGEKTSNIAPVWVQGIN